MGGKEVKGREEDRRRNAESSLRRGVGKKGEREEKELAAISVYLGSRVEDRREGTGEEENRE